MVKTYRVSNFVYHNGKEDTARAKCGALWLKESVNSPNKGPTAAKKLKLGSCNSKRIANNLHPWWPTHEYHVIRVSCSSRSKADAGVVFPVLHCLKNYPPFSRCIINHMQFIHTYLHTRVCMHSIASYSPLKLSAI